jgi:SET domain-containing protein
VSAEYLNRTVFCKLAPSPIHGIGVFAIQDIPQGQRITDYDGGEVRYITLREGQFSLLLPEIQELILERTVFDANKPMIFMSPNCNQIFQPFMNHSHKPNTDGLYALKDIKKGEELTEDYGELFTIPHYFTRMKLEVFYG